jgi:hypothetical protein
MHKTCPVHFCIAYRCKEDLWRRLSCMKTTIANVGAIIIIIIIIIIIVTC